jgi:hypothetical protein
LTAPQIKQHYENLKGNSNGVPVVYLAVNLDPSPDDQAEADRLLDLYGLSIRGNDYTATEFDVVVQRFASHAAKPVFVAINGVAGSPGTQQWQVLVNRSGVTEPQIPGLIVDWKRIIDSVKAPPPTLRTARLPVNGAFEFTFPGQLSGMNRVERSENLLNWFTVAEFTGTNGPIIFQDTEPAHPTGRFYRIVRP